MRRGLVVGLATLVALVVVSPASATADDPEGELRIESVGLVDHPTVTLAVTTPGGSAEPAADNAFTVLEDGVARRARAEYVGSVGLHVVLLIDTTGSMGGAPLAGAQAAASGFVAAVAEDARIAILGYDTEVSTVTGFAASRDEHLDGIARLTASGRTATYDAVAAAVEQFSADVDTHRVLILLTDGEDNASSRTVDDAIDALVEHDVTLFGIEYLTAFSDDAPIDAMARATGGGAFHADDADVLGAVYERLARELVSRYRVSYVTDSVGTVEVTVRVDHEGRTVTGTRTVVLPPLPVDEVATAPDDAPSIADVAIVPPSSPSPAAQRAVIIGAALWFVALMVFVMVWIGPRRGRGMLTAPRSLHTRDGAASGLRGLATRAGLAADRTLERRGHRRSLSAALERAGLDMRPGEFVVLAMAAAGVAAVTIQALAGWLAGVAAAVGTLAASRVVLRWRIRRRQAQFAEQLGDVLQLLAGSLRAGFSLMQAVDSVAKEAGGPAAQEFGRLIVETRLGRGLSEALDAMSARVQSDDFTWVLQAIEIHQEVGGDLAEVLDTVAETIRDRGRVRRQVKALSAEGRLSAYVLMAMPVGVALVIHASSPDYLPALTTHPLGWALIAVGSMLMLVGVIWMRSLVRPVF